MVGTSSNKRLQFEPESYSYELFDNRFFFIFRYFWPTFATICKIPLFLRLKDNFITFSDRISNI